MEIVIPIIMNRIEKTRESQFLLSMLMKTKKPEPTRRARPNTKTVDFPQKK